MSGKIYSESEFAFTIHMLTNVLHVIIFFQKCYFTAWSDSDLCIVGERSKDIMHVKLLPSLGAFANIKVNTGYCLHSSFAMHAAQFWVRFV